MRTTLIFASIRVRCPSFRRLLTPLVTGLLAACGNDDPFALPATVENATRFASVYALTGTSADLPAAYQMSQERFVRPIVLLDGSLNFELAFDLDAQGKVLLLPARTLAPQPPQGSPSIGLLKSAIAYDAVVRAPDKGYRLDTAAVASVGDTYLLRLVSAGCTYGEPIYAKLSIDSVYITQRRIFVRTLANRNCGFRALTAGIPKD